MQEIEDNDGELTIELEKELEELEGKIDDKIESWASFIKNQELTAKCIKDEEKRLSEKRKRIEKAVDKSKDALSWYMDKMNIETVKGARFNVSMREYKSYEYDLESIPKSYFNTVETLDKNKFKSDFKDGVISYGLKEVVNKKAYIK